MSSPVRAVAEEALSPQWPDWSKPDWSKRAAERAGDSWLEMVEQLRALQDAVAGSVPAPEVATQVAALLARSPGAARTVRGQRRGPGLRPAAGGARTGTDAHSPARHQGDGELRATTQFGAFHAGTRGAVHGGALALMFDDAMGHMAGHGDRPPFRTAYLHLDYRSVAPLHQRLTVAVRVTEQAGRKRFLHGTLHDGARLCAEATALFVDLRPGQP